MANEPLITVIGNVVAEPEARVSQAGKPWVTFRIASTPRVQDRNTNEWTDGEPLWLGCRAYGEMAEHIAQSLHKGNRVVVQGRLSQRSYTDNQGQQRTSLDLEVEEIGASLRFNNVQIHPRGQGGGGQSRYGEQQQQSRYGAQQQQQQAPPAQQQGGGFPGQAQGQPAWGQPAQADNPWANQQQQASGFGSGFDDEQPF